MDTTYMCVCDSPGLDTAQEGHDLHSQGQGWPGTAE